MTNQSVSLPAIDLQKERAVNALTRHYTSGHIDLDQFEGRLDSVYGSSTVGEIQAAMVDLPRLGASTSSIPGTSVEGSRRKTQFVGAVMSGAEHKGSWRPALNINAVALMGGIVLDFREANFASGTTELTVVALMGGVEIIVPPGLRVECEGLGVMGGFEAFSSDSVDADYGGPTLSIKGLAIFGGVDVTQRYPAESAKAAKKRLREDATAPRILGAR